MLILSRKQQETILIRNDQDIIEICITHIDKKRGIAKVGINAPMTYNIVRQEIDNEDIRNEKI